MLKAKGPFTQAIFCAIFVALFDTIFVGRKLYLQIACVNYLRFRELGGNFWEITAYRSKYRTRIAQKSPLVNTCDKSCNGERDENRIKNRMFKRALRRIIHNH